MFEKAEGNNLFDRVEMVKGMGFNNRRRKLDLLAFSLIDLIIYASLRF